MSDNPTGTPGGATPDPDATATAAATTPTPAATDATATAATAAPTDEVIARLSELGVSEYFIAKIKDELGVTTLGDLAKVTVEDLTSAEVGMKKIPARNLVDEVAPSVEVVGTMNVVEGVLPSVPNFVSLTEMLKAGGVLKVESSTVIAAVQASIADRVGLFKVPELLVDRILEFSRQNEEPVDPSYWKLRRGLTRHEYGDLFLAIDGFDGRNIGPRRKQELFDGISTHMWPAVLEFNQVLSGWMDAWVATNSNPAMMMQALSALAGGRSGVTPSIGQAPDTGGLRDQAEKFNDAVNRAFAGEGVQVAAAVAFDASDIRSALQDARLPSLVGAPNYEQMLKQLGVSVSAADPRFEVSVTQFVLSIMQVKNLSVGEDELRYFNALYMLGSQIPWGQLGVGGSGYSRIGDRSGL